MTPADASEEQERWARPQLERSHPIRTAGGFYRTADNGESGLAGVPLVAAEDAVVAAVRMAYKVAQTQVERSTRLARRLREAGDRSVGAPSDRKAVDATEEVVSRAMMSALTWLEGLAAEGDSPLKRLATAQYRIVGSMLGVGPAEDQRAATTSAPGAAAAAPPDSASSPQSKVPTRRVTVILTGRGRPVRVCSLEVERAPPLDQANISFYSIADFASEPLQAKFGIDTKGQATLTIETARPVVPGRWRAAVCDPATDEQIGLIEIEL